MIKLGVDKSELISVAIKKYGRTPKALEWLANNDIYLNIEEIKSYRGE